MKLQTSPWMTKKTTNIEIRVDDETRVPQKKRRKIKAKHLEWLQVLRESTKKDPDEAITRKEHLQQEQVDNSILKSSWDEVGNQKG